MPGVVAISALCNSKGGSFHVEAVKLQRSFGMMGKLFFLSQPSITWRPGIRAPDCRLRRTKTHQEVGYQRRRLGPQGIGFQLGRCTGLVSSGAGPLVLGGGHRWQACMAIYIGLHPLSATGNYWTERWRAAPSCSAGAARDRFRVLMVIDPAGEDHWLAWVGCPLACDFGVSGACHGQCL